MSNESISVEEFIESRLVYIYVNEFTEESSRNFYAEFMRARGSGQTIIPVMIDSHGGDADSLSAMIDVIDSAPEATVATIAIGKAMSAGAILLSCGTEGFRFAAPSSRIMLHNIGGLAYGKEPDIQVSAKETARLQKYFYGKMAQNCGHKKDYFLKLIKDSGNTDVFLTPKEAVKHNLVNQIKLPQLHTAIAIVNEMV